MAFEAAHRRGLAHRNVKPANVLFARATGADGVFVVASEIVKVADFGVLRIAAYGMLTKKTATVGTVHCHSLEQVGLDKRR